MRLKLEDQTTNIFQFQSTHSLRSATSEEGASPACPGVSIHALLAECDFSECPYEEGEIVFQSTHSLRSATFDSLAASVAETGFNPRTPCGVRPQPPIELSLLNPFQSTHSLRSATERHYVKLPRRVVSIHALLAECDAKLDVSDAVNKSFNPRTPCGVRQRLTIYIVIQQRKRYFAPTSRRRPSSPSLLF